MKTTTFLKKLDEAQKETSKSKLQFGPGFSKRKVYVKFKKKEPLVVIKPKQRQFFKKLKSLCNRFGVSITNDHISMSASFDSIYEKHELLVISGQGIQIFNRVENRVVKTL